MSWELGAATGVVPTTQFRPGSYAYTLYGYGGGAAGWAQYNTPILSGVSEWTYQAKAKWVQSLRTGAPVSEGDQRWYGEGGLLISSGEGTSGNWIWVGWNNAIGEFNANTSWAQPIIYWSLGGQSGGGIQAGAAMRSFRKGDPFTLTVSRSGNTITLTIDSPLDGQRVVTQEFTGDAAAALDTLQYVGFINYLSQWEYDDVSVSDGSGEIYANDFENGGQPGWNATDVGSYWWDRGDTGGTNGLWAFRNESTGGGAAGWAVYTAPVLTNNATNWSYSGQAKWAASHNPGVPYYGNGYLLLAAATNIGPASDFVSVGYTRGNYDDTGNAWAFPFYEYRLDGVYASGALTGGGAFRDFTNSPPIAITVSRAAGSSDLTLVIETPLDGLKTNTLSFTGDQAAALDNLQYVGLMNYYSTFQFNNLQVTTSGNAVPPTITSTNAFSATVGVAFSDNITATGDEPIVFSGAGLPAGLTVATNGLISGTPAAAGTFSNVVFTAAGASLDSQIVTFTVAKGTQAPVLGSLGSSTISSDGTTTVTASGGSGSGAYEFRQNGGTGSVVFTGTGDSCTINPLSAGTADIEVRRLADDNYNVSAWSSAGTLTINPAAPADSSFSGWLSGNSPSAALLLQYAYGAASASSAVSSSNYPSMTLSNSNLVLTYYVRKNATNLNLVTPEVATSLATNSWSNVAAGNITDLSTNTTGDGVEVIQRRASVPVDGGRKFLRLKVSE